MSTTTADLKYAVAKQAAIEWMGKSGVTADPKFSHEQLLAYADSLADALVQGYGTRDAVVNGMRLISTSFGYYVA